MTNNIMVNRYLDIFVTGSSLENSKAAELFLEVSVWVLSYSGWCVACIYSNLL